ncbi:hypothetical protein HDU88_001786 [Geranomyces variabilis]|nr:hypothetical protein HDU88_001786 [Geranomyces variabilis]
MATFTPPALPAGHWAAAAGFPAGANPLQMSGLQTLHRAYLSAAAKIVFLYDGIPNVEKVHEWGEAHAAHHDALQRADADMGSGSFTTYDYIAYRVPSTLPNRLQPWLHDILNEIVAMPAAPLTNPAAPAGAGNPVVPLIRWFIQYYIRAFQRLLQQEDMAVQINGDLMERPSTLAKRTQWFCDGIARNLRMGPHILAAIQQVILHHATVNGGHATMDQIYNATRTALSASGIADGAATGQMPIAPVPQQRPAPIPFTRPSARYEPYGFTPQSFALRPFYRPGTPSALTPRPMRMLPPATPRYRPGTPVRTPLRQLIRAPTPTSRQQRQPPTPARMHPTPPTTPRRPPQTPQQRPGPRMPRFGGQPPEHSLQSVGNNCNPKKTVDGGSLEDANMVYSVGQPADAEHDMYDHQEEQPDMTGVQHDDGQYQDYEDPNYMTGVTQEIEQEDFLSTWH